METLGYERKRARDEEEIYRAWLEDKKRNPLSFISSVEGRQEFLAATHRLTAKDWAEIRRIESETGRRRRSDRAEIRRTAETSHGSAGQDEERPQIPESVFEN